MRAAAIDINFEDSLQGSQTQNLRDETGDFMIRSSSGFYAYRLACVVDDARPASPESYVATTGWPPLQYRSGCCSVWA